MRARIRGTELYFDIEGMGLVPDGPRMREKPVMFVVHGGPGADHASHKGGMTPLADQAQLVYFDHRGQGRSARGPKETYTLENNVEDMEALRLHLGLDRIVVMGTSYGGMVAMAYALEYQRNISHLILVATAASHRLIDRAKRIVAERGTEQQRAACERLWAGEIEGDAQFAELLQILGPLYSTTFDPQKANEAGARTIYSVDAWNVGLERFMRRFDFTPRLPEIAVPTLVIAGRHDWICPPDLSEEIARLIPGADLRIFERSSHWVRADEPRALLDAVAGFLAERR
ncbi:alpha/beta fold hydrolase [Sorangium atrum]|uniref:Alpha/beta fold hydrolase n=1 Tax=Sorangium atrum TaxID=2995308 RepID=A0ABT5C2N6_9BACT|nr:alpha/beta fold hydrolase [Sorangium aterium]MDC0680125.1 alpha/beta fold hydrolase [Sorangium aterium]